ncbi:MAG TPA: gliding motility-associated C-terminal domain-containing protein [Chitinophagaceae bacterium]|nr:gliding motility-associated C-terminal domain-containing protein [Chitinophagaceae bacterium]
MKRLVVSLVLLCCTFLSRGQLCTGSLGDPVVHITFGSGNNPGTPLQAATTNYTFVSGDCPNDGFYTVRNSTSGCFGSSWYSVVEDHTAGDANGYFMLVNASFNPGDFYVDTVRGLCANTTYEFAAWILNVLRPSACGSNGIDPNLTFRIETTTGSVLATYSSGNLTEDALPTWKQYGLFFTMPASATSVVVRITNNAPGGCGNDLALDDITFRPCGPSVAATLTIGGTNASVCDGDTTSFLITGNYPGGYADPAFQWQVSVNNAAFTDIAGATSSTYRRMPTGPGKYTYRLSMAESFNMGSANCRVASNIITIEVNPLPVIQVPASIEGCFGTDVTLSAAGGATYEWTGPNGFTSSLAQPVLNDIDFSHAGLYSVKVISDKGCSVSGSGNLRVHPPVDAHVAGDDHICEGNSTLLQASGGTNYTWTPATGLSSANIADPIASPGDTTRYKVKVSSQFGCTDSAEIVINVWKKPVAAAGPDLATREGVPVLIDAKAAGTDVSWFWSPFIGLNDPDLLKPTALLSDDMKYALHVVSNKGCGISIDSVFVKVYKKVVVPNAFSPNNDGVNDLWLIQALQTYPNPEVTVFNRYGQAVFRSKGYSKPWDGTFKGKKLPTGTYYYVIDLKIGEPPMNGWVMIFN